MTRALVVHGHFYQPPRENPWTQQVEREVGAEPFHDWNERVFAECYRPNAYARVFDDAGRVDRIVNNYRHISFNFGPTLLQWLEREHTITYGRIISADRDSARARGGHGNAIAQAYNHLILPLANAQDRRTQVLWGIADFSRHFSRKPEGMWLPETAASHEVLDTLIDAGLKFTILSPYQAGRVRSLEGGEWTDVTGGRVDPTQPYRYFARDGSRRSIDIFFYDGPRSRSIAFEGALSSSSAFVDHLTRNTDDRTQCVSVATDGESYGHHSKFGDRCLAHAMVQEVPDRELWLTNYGQYLEQNPPTMEAEIDHGPDGLGTSWSCAHGVGRWFRDCGCSTGAKDGWNQRWRTPLRDALDVVRDHGIALFEQMGGTYLKDPWAARDDYASALFDPERARDAFFDRHAKKTLDADDRVRVLSLLEMQHHAMLMYTSCGWFFSDVSGIETQQILRYAARALELAESLGTSAPYDGFMERLGEAESNRPEMGSGADVFRRFVDTARVSPTRVAAHLAMTGLVDESAKTGELAGYDFERTNFKTRQHGRIKMCTGRVRMEHTMTEAKDVRTVAGVHLGGVDFYCAVNAHLDDTTLGAASEKLWNAFTTSSVPKLLKIASEEFGGEDYGLEHMLPGGAEHISELILGSLLHRFSEQYAQLYEDNRRTLDMLGAVGFELPKELSVAAEFTLGRRFEAEIRAQNESQDIRAYKRAIDLAEMIAESGYRVDRSTSSKLFTQMITHGLYIALARSATENWEAVEELMELAERLGLTPDLENAQEAMYEAVSSRGEVAGPEVERVLVRLGLSPQVIGRGS